ncbi:hypothetical protein QBC44DRAFT_98126, partial [Cladorrhinum sp. PSN332]
LHKSSNSLFSTFTISLSSQLNQFPPTLHQLISLKMEYHTQLHFQTHNQMNSFLSAPANGSNGPTRKRSRTLRDDDCAESQHEDHHLAKRTRRHVMNHPTADTAFPSFPSFASARDFSPATSASSTEPNTPASEDVIMDMDMQMDVDPEQERQRQRQQQQLRQIQLQVQQHQQHQAMLEAQYLSGGQAPNQRCTVISGFNQRLRNQQCAAQTSWPNRTGYF